MASFKFQTIEEINNYRLMTITSQAKFFADFIKHVYKAINKDMIYIFKKKHIYIKLISLIVLDLL